MRSRVMRHALCNASRGPRPLWDASRITLFATRHAVHIPFGTCHAVTHHALCNASHGPCPFLRPRTASRLQACDPTLANLTEASHWKGGGHRLQTPALGLQLSTREHAPAHTHTRTRTFTNTHTHTHTRTHTQPQREKQAALGAYLTHAPSLPTLQGHALASAAEGECQLSPVRF